MIKWIKQFLCVHVKDVSTRKSTGIYRMTRVGCSFPQPEYQWIVWKKCVKCGKEFIEYEWITEKLK